MSFPRSLEEVKADLIENPPSVEELAALIHAHEKLLFMQPTLRELLKRGIGRPPGSRKPNRDTKQKPLGRKPGWPKYLDEFVAIGVAAQQLEDPSLTNKRAIRNVLEKQGFIGRCLSTRAEVKLLSSLQKQFSRARKKMEKLAKTRTSLIIE